MTAEEVRRLFDEFMEAVGESDLSPEAIADMIGGTPSGPTIRRYEREGAPGRLDHAVQEGMRRFLTSHRRGETILPTKGASAAGGEFGAWYLAELRRISELNEPEWRKHLYREGLQAACREQERLMAEEARILAEKAGLERATALRVDAQTAAARQVYLHPDRPQEWDEEAIEETNAGGGVLSLGSEGRSRK